jgi:hypothetical protein
MTSRFDSVAEGGWSGNQGGGMGFIYCSVWEGRLTSSSVLALASGRRGDEGGGRKTEDGEGRKNKKENKGGE